MKKSIYDRITVTHQLYDDLTRDKHHVLTLQPRYYDDSDDTSKSDDDELANLYADSAI